MNVFKAAVVQAASKPDDSLASAQKAAHLIREASAAGARLIVFPEAYLGGYPKGASFGCPIGMRKPEGREAFRQYFERAISLAGEEVEIIAQACAQTQAFAVIGCIERDGGTLYCTALFFDGERGLVAKHRKLMPTAGERLIWGFGDGLHHAGHGNVPWPDRRCYMLGKLHANVAHAHVCAGHHAVLRADG